MSEIFHFVPKVELEANLNLKRFIENCKSNLTVFGKSLNWDDWKWPKAGNFTKIGANSKTKNIDDRLNENFIEFAKAYFRYQQAHNPTGTKNELKALRAIENALLQVSHAANISDLSLVILDEAVQIIKRHYSAGAAYHGGREIERLACFVSTKNLIPHNLSHWKSPIPRKKDEIQTGPEAKSRREKKLPSEVALNALAEIFSNNPQDPRDLFTSSTFAMLMSAPSRITEVLTLQVNCEVEQKDSKGELRYGWRFYSGKGFGANIKWIPTEMVSIAKEAIRRVTKLTEESRSLANWIEKNPSKFYRHSNCPEVADDTKLTALEVCAALGFKAKSMVRARANLRSAKLIAEDFSYTLDSLWMYVMARQPKDFPWINSQKRVKFSEALFCMSRNLIGSNRGESPVILWMPTNNILNNDLSPRDSCGVVNHQSIFDRNNYLTSEGCRIKLTSHQARHLLNTMAQRGGLSQLAIAKWSGRADITQNSTYNHICEYEMVSKAEELDTSLGLFGPEGDIHKNLPISIQEFNALEKGPLHVTEFGVCVHDFTMMPCDKYRDCLNCAEQVCIKGDESKLSHIKKRQEEIILQLNAARKAIDEGLSGADRWYEYHTNTLKHVEELISILENPNIKEGAQVKLRNEKVFSPIRRAIEGKLASKDSQHSGILEDMTKLLGGGFGQTSH